jgi:hypothetical protein
MDSLRFDRMVQSLAESGSRRRFIAGIAAGALGISGWGQATARTCSSLGAVCREAANCCSGACGPKDRTGRRTCVCNGLEDCPAPANGAAFCTAGRCETTCNEGYEQIEGACKLPFGAPCSSGSQCAGGACAADRNSSVCATRYAAGACEAAGGSSQQVFRAEGGGDVVVCAQRIRDNCEDGECPQGQICGVDPTCLVLIDSTA